MDSKEIKKMPVRNILIERRQHPRFTITTDASLKKCPHCPGLGPLIDIGWGGVSFHYEDNGNDLSLSNIDIFFGNDIFVLENIPCRKIITSPPAQKGQSTFSKSVKRIGVQFDTLNPNLQKQLTYLLQLNSLIPGKTLSLS